MNKLMELYEKRNKAVADARAFLDNKRNESDVLSEEDNAIYTKMENNIMSLTKEIERESRLTAIDAEMSKPTSSPILSSPAKLQTNENPKTGVATAEYKDSMLNALRSNFRRINNILQEGVDADGGYLVPSEYDTRLIEGLTEENIIRKLATTIKTGAERKINIAASTPAAAWIDEGGALTFGDAKFEQINLDAHKLHVAVKVTEELLYDNVFNLESYILNKFAKALANAEEDAFLNGDGVGKPLGIFAATGGGEIGVTAASATTITADEIINLIYTLKRPYRKSATFIINDQTLAILRKLKDGNGAYIWQPSYQVGEPDSLLGYPVYTSAYVPTVAAGKPVIAFGDFSYYNIGDRGPRSFAELKELFAGNGMVGFVAKERVDGKLVLPETVQILKMKVS
ncbi:MULTISPECIES: phage major capsid protein [Clostridium]|uniref:Phage major capsid protein, HK97 family n=2 Tax=Clostridium TaxID=1485 RepID=A0A381JBE3_9CLOT|nr:MULTISPECIES: phage major capsid protein [Clostridium]PPK44967.1 HK97 family phage major capsid protein [Clostridium algidicarnis DSM 15099]SUY47702.1 phage major capsid protein, HK97 family [Clostridium putrefaciens]